MLPWDAALGRDNLAVAKPEFSMANPLPLNSSGDRGQASTAAYGFNCCERDEQQDQGLKLPTFCFPFTLCS